MTLGSDPRRSRWRRVAVGRRSRVGLGLVVAWWLARGCDSGSFLPPRPPELGGGKAGARPRPAAGHGATGSATTPSSGARAIELILGPPRSRTASTTSRRRPDPRPEREVRIQVDGGGREGNPDSEAELVRKAIAREALALVLDCLDQSEPELARAVAEARGRGCRSS